MIRLDEISTKPPREAVKEEYRAKTEELLEKLRELQKKLYAQAEYSLLVVLQGLDASGKDGAINHVFSGLNLLGCEVTAFKAPSEEEKKHDFLWRVHQRVPAKGMIGLFNRSHYEDVLVPRVQKWVDAQVIKDRYGHINHFEQLLADSQTTLVKCYLHVSAEEQQGRLVERTQNPEKYWKHDDGDWAVAAQREQYLEAYEDVFRHCSEAAPWHIVPADKNWYKHYTLARVTVEALEKLPLAYPAFR